MLGVGCKGYGSERRPGRPQSVPTSQCGTSDCKFVRRAASDYRPRVFPRLVPHSPEGTPQSLRDIEVSGPIDAVQGSTELDLDDVIPNAVEGTDTNSVVDVGA